MKNTDLVSIGELYGGMLNSFKKNITESTKKNKNAFGDQPKLVGKGPHTDGYNNALNDNEDVSEEDEEDVKPSKRQSATKELESKLNDPKISENEKKKIKKEIDSRSAEEAEEIAESQKIGKKILNKFMSNKSMFDKLYNKVLKENFGMEGQENNALGLDNATPDADLGDDGLGGEEGETVTFTLDRATAQALVDVLQTALGDEGLEGEDGGEDTLDFEGEGGEADEFGGEEDEMSFEEDEEVGTKTAPDKKTAYMGKDNKVSGPPKPKSGHAKADVTNKTDTTQGAPPITALQGKSNQVPGSTVKVGDYFK